MRMFISLFLSHVSSPYTHFFFCFCFLRGGPSHFHPFSVCECNVCVQPGTSDCFNAFYNFIQIILSYTGLCDMLDFSLVYVCWSQQRFRSIDLFVTTILQSGWRQLQNTTEKNNFSKTLYVKCNLHNCLRLFCTWNLMEANQKIRLLMTKFGSSTKTSLNYVTLD